MVPLLIRGLRERSTPIKRKSALIIDNMSKVWLAPAYLHVHFPLHSLQREHTLFCGMVNSTALASSCCIGALRASILSCTVTHTPASCLWLVDVYQVSQLCTSYQEGLHG